MRSRQKKLRDTAVDMKQNPVQEYTCDDAMVDMEREEIDVAAMNDAERVAYYKKRERNAWRNERRREWIAEQRRTYIIEQMSRFAQGGRQQNTDVQIYRGIPYLLAKDTNGIYFFYLHLPDGHPYVATIKANEKFYVGRLILIIAQDNAGSWIGIGSLADRKHHLEKECLLTIDNLLRKELSQSN